VKEVIKHLRENGRITLSDLARRIDEPISTVSDRVKRIEKKYFTKYCPLLEYAEFGYNCPAVIALGVPAGHKQNLLEFLKEDRRVNSLYHVDSGFQFLVEVICKDKMELNQWLDGLQTEFQSVVDIFPVLKIEEREKFVP
jgi:DNA-binding Lrp family transcriptional regulator